MCESVDDAVAQLFPDDQYLLPTPSQPGAGVSSAACFNDPFVKPPPCSVAASSIGDEQPVPGMPIQHHDLSLPTTPWAWMPTSRELSRVEVQRPSQTVIWASDFFETYDVGLSCNETTSFDTSKHVSNTSKPLECIGQGSVAADSALSPSIDFVSSGDGSESSSASSPFLSSIEDFNIVAGANSSHLASSDGGDAASCSVSEASRKAPAPSSSAHAPSTSGRHNAPVESASHSTPKLAAGQLGSGGGSGSGPRKQRGGGRRRQKIRLHAWTEEEQAKFLDALERCRTAETEAVNAKGERSVGLGQGVAEAIASLVGTRNAAQVRSHAQKHFHKQRRDLDALAAPPAPPPPSNPVTRAPDAPLG
eukprot:1383203-Rhodomonas_salina.2